MYTQIILLLFAVHSLSAYSIVQIELKNGKEVSDVKELSNNTLEFISDQSKLPTLRQIIFVVDKYLQNNEDKDNTIKKKPPQEIPIELDGSLRAFTNGHGFQFADWELIDEHQLREPDKVQDKAADNDNDIDSGDAGYDDDTTDDETDKHDDKHEVPEIPGMVQRHLDIDKAKTSRNKMFDKMKEKYRSKKRNDVDPSAEVRRKRQLNYQNIPGGNQYNIDPTAIPDYKNRMLMNRAPYDNSKNVMNPVLRDEHGNILYDNINTVYSGGIQFANPPIAYGMNMNNEQGYPYYVNNMQNEPLYNYYINQPVPQRPIESHTVNNNPYKQANTPEVVVTNVQQLPKSEINDIDNLQKLIQVPNHETLNRVPKEVENKNTSHIIEIEKANNNGEVNTTKFKHNKEMLHNVNQMSRKIGSIKEKVKDRFANMLNTPEGRKLLTHGMTKTSDKGQTKNDTAAPHVKENDLPPHSSNFTTNDNLEVNPNNIIAINNTEDINVMESNRSNERNDTTNSLVEITENIEIKINENIAKPETNTASSNTVQVNNTEPTANQTIVENKCGSPELPATEILTITRNETAIIEKGKDKESEPVKLECFNGTSMSTEIKEQTSTKVIEETKTETPVANKTNDESCSSEVCQPVTSSFLQIRLKEKCDADDSKVGDVSENVNFDDLFNTDEFWDWLSKWTTAYMEILKENVEVMVKEEVAKQLEEMFSKAEKEMADHSETSKRS